MSDQSLLLTATILVLITVGFVFYIKTVKANWVKVVLDWFPAILFAYVIPAVFTHALHIDLSGVALHDLSKTTPADPNAG